MANPPKHFQQRTAEAALKALTTGSRRFLLADEVGLGKTIVAREVIAELARRRRGDEPFRVYYFGSGRTVTAQNAPRLCADATSALCDASRPSLMAMSDIPKAKVLVFQFTPETAVPRVHGRGRSGVAMERALLRVLVSKVLRYRVPRKEEVRMAFRGAASKKGFRQTLRFCVRQYREGKLLPGYGLSEAFRSAAREVFGAAAYKHLPQRLEAEFAEDARICVAKLREALTRAALRCLPPHLIVFDEFHKYRKRVFALPGAPPGEKDEHVFLSLLSSNNWPAVLLLSATPFQQEQAASRGREVHADSSNFHRLVGFLHGSGAEGEAAFKSCAGLFAEFERALGGGQFEDLARLRRGLEEKLLRPCMARMERAAFRREAGEPASAKGIDALPQKEDLDLFLRFADALQDKDKPAALAYWRAVPYPHQFLGGEYVAWKDARRSKWRDLSAVTSEQRSRLRMRHPVPSPRFRELLDRFPAGQLALPWMPPSAPWWPLRGPWAVQDAAQRGLEKGLLFSAYRAAPRSIAGLMSFAVEDWAARERGWQDLKKLKRSFLAPKSISVVALFHPSLWLAETVDPLAARNRSTDSLVHHAAKAIRASLPATVQYQRGSKRHRPLWCVLPMLECATERGPALRELWRDTVAGDFRGQVGRAVARMQDAAGSTEPILSPVELQDLAWFALSAPGVVLLRALRRNWTEVTTDRALAAVADLSWNGLRPYLDRPWFVARLMKGKGRAVSGYPEAIQRAVLEGNLESVLDEHFWLPDPDHEEWMRKGKKRGRLHALRDTLSIRSAPVKVFSPGNPSRSSLKLAAHAVLPLTDTEAHTATAGGTKQLRADDLRQAFNTPFWPHVLCTTSVGQEGLDFHQWCRCVVHWDLCSSPVDMEQREGRIDRFKSLAVRRALADKLKGEGVDTWAAIEQRAQRFVDYSELEPWWIFHGARMEKLFLDPPSSEERGKKERLHRLRELYRLVLGLPHSQDMLIRLDSLDVSIETIRSHCLDLGALRRPS